MEESQEEKLTVVQVSPEYHQRLKMRGAELKKTVKEIINEILADFFGKNNNG